MSAVLRSVLLIILILPWGFSHAADKPFFHSQTAQEAARYKAQIIRNAKAQTLDSASLVRVGERALKKGDARKAAAAFKGAAGRSGENGQTWLKLARATLMIAPANGREKYDIRANASAAAYLAFKHAANDRTKAEALALLGETLTMRSYWRPAINAYKASLDLVAAPVVQRAYEALRAERGFRILDYKVDSEALSPRLCVQFSEPLGKGRIDFAKFISVDGKDPSAVNAEEQAICVEGLKHGRRYQVTVRSGLPSSVGESLLKTARLGVYVRDRAPSVRFTGRNYVLPNKGQQGIPVISVNTEKVLLQIYRVGDRGLSRIVIDGDFQRQFTGYQANDLEQRLGQHVWKGELDVRKELNADVTTALPVSEVVPDLAPGVYVMIGRADGGKTQQWQAQATQWFIVSDLGLTALSGDDGVHAFVRSLATADPTGAAKVRLVARNNEVLASATTDASGHARFPAGLAKGEGGMEPALLVAEGADGDYAFLDLTTNAFDLTDRGVAGRQTPGPLDAFITTERGIYRPGADVHITTLVRNDKVEVARGLPITLIMSRPDGVEHRRVTLSDQGQGGRTHKLAMASSAMTGTWRVRAYADPKAEAIGETSFLLEDFVPERLDLTLNPAGEMLVPGEIGEIGLKGRYLYGPPAANLAVEGEITVRPRVEGLAAHEGYQFGLEDEKVHPVREDFADLPSTDQNGEAKIAVALPGLPRTSRLLEARIMLRLREPGGRTIERNTTLPIAARRPLIGIRPLFKADELGRGETAAFDVIMLDAAGRQVAAKNLRWEVLRVERHYQWYSRGGYWNYEPITYTRRVADGRFDAVADKPGRIELPVGWGRYRVEVTTGDPAGPASSVGFSAGWYASDGADSPEILEVALDKERYLPGDTANVTIEPDGAGKALIAIVGNGLLATQEVNVPADGVTVPFKVDEKWGPGAYATAMFYRPMDIKAKRMPNRSVGVKWLALDQSHRTIVPKLELPEKVASATTLDVPIRLDGLEKGEEAYVVVAAVDIGILNLTRFKTPAPDKWFYAQRRLGTEIRDLYGRLIDGMRATRGAVRSGGDGGGMTAQGSPPVEAPLSLFSGMVKASADGMAHVTFDLPEFNGTIRLMAMAWSGNKVGHASGDVIVRDPVAMLVTAPRFLTMGDESRVQVDLHNVEGAAGTYRVTVVADDDREGGRLVLDRELALAANERKFHEAPIRATRVGRTTYLVRATGPDGIDVQRRIALDVKAPAPSVRRRTVKTLAAKGGKLTVSADLFGDLIAERSTVTVSAGPAAQLDVAGLMVSLDRYPYGCAEQTTSKALPLLYLSSLSSRLGLAPEADLRGRVQKAIDRVLELQASSGGFGLWSPIGGDIWLTSYIADFLTRAREQGYDVRKGAYEQALDRLQNYVNFVSDFEKGGEQVAYALYVLARTGRAPIGDLRYYVDTRLERFSTPLAKAQLGAALAMYGDKARARTAIAAAMSMLAPNTLNLSRGDYGSQLRDRAATLTLVAETGAAPASVPKLTELVATALNTKSNTTTQENAWMLLAARSLMERSDGLRLSVDGVSQKGSVLKGVSASDLERAPIIIENDGEEPATVVVSVTGEAATPEPATMQGLRVERSYFTLDGKPVDMASGRGGESRLAQNQRLVVVLKVEVTDGSGGRLLLVDRLAGGLEIENPRIVDSANLKALDWLQTTVYPEHTAFRDDRFVASFNLWPGSGNEKSNALTLAYMVRAVSPGRYLHPPATVEDMYRGERFARTSSGTLHIDKAE